MNLEISCVFRGNSLTLSLAVPFQRTTFILKVVHPAFDFIWLLSQGSCKALHSIQPLRIVDGGEKESENSATEIKPALLSQVEKGIERFPPELCEDGINGTYFLRDENGKFCGVYKPTDEEGNSANNPKRSDENRDVFASKGIMEGEGALREVAAYRLDSGHFSGVPETFMAQLQHPNFKSEGGIPVLKNGSLQTFVDNDGNAEDVGPSKFPVRQVHKIGILDMRIFNNDRHGGNILLREKDDGTIELIPIDHGLSLPSTLDRAWFDWLTWSQAKVPFDDETREYIDRIDVEADVKTLRESGISEESIRTMIISTTLLKKGAAANLTLYEIASMVCRSDLDTPSLLETMVEKASQQVQYVDMLEALWPLMDADIAQV